MEIPQKIDVPMEMKGSKKSPKNIPGLFMINHKIVFYYLIEEYDNTYMKINLITDYEINLINCMLYGQRFVFVPFFNMENTEFVKFGPV